jgi:hypothetical protein
MRYGGGAPWQGKGMRFFERALSFFLIVAAVVTAYYRWSYSTGDGGVMVSTARWYTAFESSFTVADTWLAICAALAGVGLWLDRSWAARFALMAGAMFLYLAAMDITFNVENGMYALAAASDAMKFEIFINASSIILGVWSLIVSWRRIG